MDDHFHHPLAGAILRSVRALGFRISVFESAGSMFGKMPPFVEIHAVDVDTEPSDVHVVWVSKSSEADSADSMLYRAACGVAESVGIDLED